MTQQTASDTMQGSRFQNSYGGNAGYEAQNSWQYYYDCARQLYSAGDAVEAGRYYEYARQLYDTMLHSEQQPAASSQGSRETEGTAAAQTEAATADWEAYYNYAQQLHAAGYSEQAEAYYRQAQHLFTEAASRLEYQTAAAGVSNSVAPQYAASTMDSYAPQNAVEETSSYAPAVSSSVYGEQSSYMPAASNSVYGDHRSYVPSQQASAVGGNMAQPAAASWTAPYEEDEPIKRPKRPLKQRIKIWTAVTLVFVAIVGIGGFLALFSVYKEQLGQTDAERTADNSFFGKVKNATIQPMVDGLSPAFDKAVRLSNAAQPLLYELHLRDTPPRNYGIDDASTTSSTETPLVTPSIQDASSISTVDSAVVSGAAQTETTTADEQPVDEEKVDAEGQAVAPSSTVEKNTVENDETVSDDASEDAKKVSKPKKNRRAKRAAAKRRRHSKRNARIRHTDTISTRTEIVKTKQGKTKRRNAESGLSDDPLGTFSL